MIRVGLRPKRVGSGSSLGSGSIPKSSCDPASYVAEGRIGSGYSTFPPIRARPRARASTPNRLSRPYPTLSASFSGSSVTYVR